MSDCSHRGGAVRTPSRELCGAGFGSGSGSHAGPPRHRFPAPASACDSCHHPSGSRRLDPGHCPGHRRRVPALPSARRSGKPPRGPQTPSQTRCPHSQTRDPHEANGDPRADLDVPLVRYGEGRRFPACHDWFQRVPRQWYSPRSRRSIQSEYSYRKNGVKSWPRHENPASGAPPRPHREPWRPRAPGTDGHRCRSRRCHVLRAARRGSSRGLVPLSPSRSRDRAAQRSRRVTSPHCLCTASKRRSRGSGTGKDDSLLPPLTRRRIDRSVGRQNQSTILAARYWWTAVPPSAPYRKSIARVGEAIVNMASSIP